MSVRPKCMYVRTFVCLTDTHTHTHRFNIYPVGWGHAMNTPFQWTKQIASHYGGTRNPLGM